MLSGCIKYLKTANIYIKKDDDTIEIQQNQLFATRLFSIFFLMSLIGLVGYAGLTLRLSNVQVKNPSQSTFEKLYADYSKTLSCSCSQTSIQINKFVNFTISYHQICTSIFVTDEFISSISNPIPNIYYSLDIRRVISSQLQLIASQCRSSQIMVTETLDVLLSNRMFIPKMITRDAINSQINILVDEAIQSVISKQKQIQEYFQIFLHASIVFNSLSGNFFYMNINNQQQGFYTAKYFKNWTYSPDLNSVTESDVCYCTDESTCVYPSGIYPNLTGYDSYEYYGIVNPSIISSKPIRGLYAGCMPYGSILQSTLECFYDDYCLSQLFINIENIQPLNHDINSVYSNNTTIDFLIQQLFIETISITKKFELFYSECKPNKCLYSYSSKGDATFVILTILSLMGGLFVALQMISMFIVNLYQAIRKKCSQRSSYSRINNLNALSKKLNSTNIKKIYNTILETSMNFNLFEEAHLDEYKRQNGILSTRIYILLMIIGCTIIALYTSIIPYNLTYTIDSPSIDTYRKFVDKYPSLTCQCQQTISNYSVFISFSPRFHQFCYTLWPSYFKDVHYAPLTNLYIISGFVVSLASEIPYYAARIFCEVGVRVITESITAYLTETYLSTYLTHEDEFVSSINISIRNFETSLLTTMAPILELSQGIIQGNQLLSGGFTNAEFIYNSSLINEEDRIQMRWINPMNKSCNCALTSDLCTISLDKYCNYTSTYGSTDTCSMPNANIHISCYPLGTVLAFRLDCFYDKGCTRAILSGIQYLQNIDLSSFPISNFTMNPNVTSRFPINSSILTIMNALGIEEWNDQINYDSYYKNCNPVKCFYTITKNLYISTIITTITGLFGGLSVVLKILIPLMIQLIRWFLNKQRETIMATYQDRWYRRLIKRIREMNFFQNIETNENINNRRNQIVATRLYIIFWTISLTIVCAYNGLNGAKSNFEVKNSSINIIEQYQSQNLDEFTCPCSKIAIPFQTFTSLDFNLHQICSSNFISNAWLEALFQSSMGNSVHIGVLASHFTLLRSFCQTANTTLSNSINNFNLMEFISINLLTEKQLIQQTESFIEDFQNKTINTFKSSLSFIIDIILGNQLMSIYGTNWYFIPDPNGSNALYTKSRSYNNCSCGTPQSLTCKDSLIIKNHTIISGMYIGCLPITSLRLSTLECFYNQTCLNEIKETLNLQNMSLNSLDPFASSQYSINTTLNYIIDRFMLEKWTNQINYTQYFDTCNLEKCTYSTMDAKNPLAICTNLLGLYGGLTVSLRFLAPLVVQIGVYFRTAHRRTRQITPERF